MPRELNPRRLRPAGRLAATEHRVARRSHAPPHLERAAAPRRGDRQVQRQPIRGVRRLGLAVRERQAAREPPVAGCGGMGEQRVIQRVLHRAGDSRLLPAQVLGPVDVVRGRRRRDEGVAVRWVGDVAVLGVVDREALARAVHALQPVQRALEVGDPRERRDIGIRGGLDRRAGVVRIRVVGEPGGVEQRRVLPAEAARARGCRRAAQRPSGVPAELAVVRVDAVQRAQELQRLGLPEVPRKSLGMSGAGAAAQSERRELADQDRVVPVSGRLERVPHLTRERPIHRRGHRHG